MSQELEAAIFRTVAWFGLFDVPVTTFEIWKWLLKPDRRYALSEVDAALSESVELATKLVQRDGFTATLGASIPDLLDRRQERFLDAARKFKKLKAAARFMSAIPSVRAVAACNTLAWHQTTRESDIDLFVLCEPGTVWTTRLCLVTPCALLRRRPGEAAFDPFCFSFFLASDRLDLASLALKPEDPYLAFWSVSVVPVFDPDGLFDQYQTANDWTDGYLPNAHPHPGHEQLRPGQNVPRLLPRVRFFEPLARRLQERKFPKAIRDLANRDSRVVLSNHMLKFHENDRRAEYRDRWHASL